MRIHHFGYAVSDLDGAIRVFSLLGYSLQGEPYTDDRRRVKIALIQNGIDILELISPLTDGSPIDSILRRNGPICYHICYLSDDMSEDLNYLQKNGFIIIEERSDAPALSSDAKVVFLFHKVIGMIELVSFS